MFKKIIFFILVTMLIFGCGGGTTGTGLQSYEGTVSNLKKEPLSNVLVILLETGVQTKTDTDGNFKLKSDVAFLSSVNIKFEKENLSLVYPVKQDPKKESTVRLNVQLDEKRKEITVTEFSARVGIVGACDIYFENNEIIRQASRVPEGTICTVKAILYGDGQRVAGFPVALQYRSCHANSPWITIETVKTRGGARLGVAQIPFEFKDSRQFCEYRVLAPVGIDGYKPFDRRIITFTYQETDN